jgi:ATP-binding protein involved in chromosome partitioning
MSDSCGANKKHAGSRSEERQALTENLRPIRHKLLVLSGKGGVGKSTVAVNLAVALAEMGLRVGLLDVDVHGPTVPVLLALEGHQLVGHEGRMIPVLAGDIKVTSIAFALGSNDRPVIWRGPLKMGVIEQFLRDTDWGALDFLIIDAPPGTGDEPLSVAQLVPDAVAVVVTTPQKVATVDVRKSITFCRELKLRVLGVVENMNGVICPNCRQSIRLFPEGPVKAMTEELATPLLASLPMDPHAAAQADLGRAAVTVEDSPLRPAFLALAADLVNRLEVPEGTGDHAPDSLTTLCIAIPIAGDRLGAHFGHCDSFAFLDLDTATGSINGKRILVPPPHEPGVIPRWVAAQNAHLVLAGGMGAKAISLFVDAGVDVLTGCPCETPEELVRRYADGTLLCGDNVCGHDGGHSCGH